MHAATLVLCLAALTLGAQETPRPNRVAWLEVFPEPLPDGTRQITLEMTSQFLRPDFEQSADGRTAARLDGEEWQLMEDLPIALGPGILNVRLRVAHRSGGVADQLLQSWHRLLGTDTGGRDLAPKGRLSYDLERDGVLVARLDRPGLHLLDTDIAYVLPWGHPASGGDWASPCSFHRPAGGLLRQRRPGWHPGPSGLEGLRDLAPPCSGRTGRHRPSRGQPLPRRPGTPGLQPRLGRFRLPGPGTGILEGPGPGYHPWPMRRAPTGWKSAHRSRRLAAALDLQHTAMPNWRLGFSEEAGTYTAPDITAFVSRSF